MNPSRSIILALSAALMFSIGSSASTATTNYSHPEFSVAEDRVLNLRETSSKIVIQIIENTLRQGGLALLGEGFQLDSSLSYHSGDNEGIEGDLDVVIPLWDGGRHVVFAQPGAVFWTGIEEEERIDGNIGLVYRAELIRDLVAGVSVFYDHDFQIGHSRVSGGLDLQSGFFRFGANYYHVLSEVEDGREGFVEEAVDGMDARLVFERDMVRLGSTIGYWEYDGGEDVEDEWKTSIGMDFGFRILPGVFMEGSWERYKDDLVLDERIFAGLAFRFSLPDFEGASYGNGEMSSNLYKIVDRERRILYEERVSGPRVSIVRTGNETIPADPDEDVTIAVDVRLSEALAEDVTLNLVAGEASTATYGSSNDWTISVGSMTCTAVTEDNCQVTIAMGETSPSDDIVITINADGLGESDETIILSMVIADAGMDLMIRNSTLSFTIPKDPPIPTVSLNYSGSGSVVEGNTATMTVALSRSLNEDVIVNLVGTGSTATYGSGNDWQLNNGTTDCTGVTRTTCQVTIAANQTSADVTISILDDMSAEGEETIAVAINIASAGSTGLVLGNSTSQSIDISAHLPTVSFNYGGSTRVQESADTNHITMTLELSEALTQAVTLDFVAGMGTAVYGRGVNFDWQLRRRVVSMGGVSSSNVITSLGCLSLAVGSCQITFQPGETIADVHLEITISLQPGTAPLEPDETLTLEISIPSAASNLVELGNPSSIMLTIEENRG